MTDAAPDPAREPIFALMSHELRTPLNGVLGMAGLLAATELSPTQRAYLSTLRESGEHLLGLVNDILDFARLEAGAVELEETDVDLERLLQGVAELLSPKAFEKGLEIAWAVSPGASQVRADDGRLRQILFNLAGNAVKFTGTGGVLLRADAKARPDGRLDLVLEVTDTGPGVPPEARGRIFEAFGHARVGDAARFGGTGLGLAVVKRLAEALGGEIAVDSPPGGGATFHFTAPVQAAQAPPGADARLAGRTVAVVTACASLREAACVQVRASGGQAVAAEDLALALRRTPLDAVLLVDGALHGGTAPPPPDGRDALILLAPEERARIGRYRRQGWAGYLIKPLRRTSVVERVLAVRAPDAAREDERLARAAATGLRVLLAEDNPVNALLATAVLIREGAQVERAASGAEATAALARGGHDLVLMDVRLGDTDGRTVARAYRLGGGRAPIIALTAHAFEEDRRACLEAGMDDFLTKPLDFEALRAVLSRWTGAATQARLTG